MLHIEPLVPLPHPARLRDFVWGGAEWDQARHRRGDGATWIVRSRVVGDRRELRHWRDDGDRVLALDHTAFRLAPDFAEIDRRYTRAGPNHHARDISLPARLVPDAPVTLAPGATLVLAWHGPAALVVEDTREERVVVALRVAAGGLTRIQWLAHGVGEIALGLESAPFERWLDAWQGGGDLLFGGIPEDARARELPELPDEAPARSAGLF